MIKIIPDGGKNQDADEDFVGLKSRARYRDSQHTRRREKLRSIIERLGKDYRLTCFHAQKH